MKKTQLTQSFFLFIVACTLYAGLCFTLVDFIDNPISCIKDIITICIYCGVVCCANFLILYTIGANKYVFAASFPIYTTLGTIVAYYRYAYKATVTPMLIDATLKNDLRTSLDVINIDIIALIVINLIISIIAVRFRLKQTKTPKYWGLHMILSAGLLLIYLNVHPHIYRGTSQRYPVNVYHNYVLYRELCHEIKEVRINPDPNCYTDNNDDLTVIFVLGESARPDHFGVNGYYRETTPLLSKERNLVSFPNISSEYTYTAGSVAHILTRANSEQKELAYSESSFVPLFNSCGFYSAWIANQEPMSTYVNFMNECDSICYLNTDKSVYLHSKWLDEVAIKNTIEIDKQVKNERKLYIVHTIGSHWYYDNHYTEEFKKFTPTTDCRVVVNNDSLNIVNSYDNTILYTDYMLHSIIENFRDRNAIMIYLSDHGEALGENGQWLHASDSEFAKETACIVWYSDIYEETYPEKVNGLKANQNKEYKTDLLFHSILSAASIQSKAIEEKFDIFHQ